MHQFKLTTVLFAAVAMLAVGMPQAANATESNELNESKMEHPSFDRHRHRRPVVVGPRRAHRMGHYFGFGAVGNYFIQSSDNISKLYNGGGGLSLFYGMRLNPSVAVELGWMAAFQSTERSDVTNKTIKDGAIQSISADAKIYFMPHSQRIEPFFQIGVGAYMLTEKFVSQLTGFGVRVGVGMDVRLSPFVSIGARLLYHGFHVDNAEESYLLIPTESAFLNTVSGHANLQFHF